MRFNISDKNGRIMLLHWTTDYIQAHWWLGYYMEKYSPGSPYPNGKGVYPDFGFHIVTLH